MYEHMTFETLLKRILSQVPNDIDKREGSIIYDAVAPCALELQVLYIELDTILRETFADTSSRDFLIRRCAERGITPYKASTSVLRGVFNMEISIGEKFSCGEIYYTVVGKICDFEFMLKCESVGTIGNRNFGRLIPINYIKGLESAELTELLIPGEDEEETEALRNRYFESFDIKAYGGNIKDYLDKTNSIGGVGATKVTPIWNGGGTVKLTILDALFNPATDILIDHVQQIIDPTKDGFGIGVAPIGHIVTVETAKKIKINISFSLTFETGYNYMGLRVSIEEAIEGYLLELREEWAHVNNTVVRISHIESRLMALKGVLDIADTKINESTENKTLYKYHIPVLGVITNE